MEEIPADEWNKDKYVFDEETLQLTSWARSEWARKYAPIPALKGVHTTTQNAKLVLSAIADYSNPTYLGSWPSIDKIKAETELSRRAIQYALRALEAMGLIEEAPHLAAECPAYLAIPADKRPVFYHVYFVFDRRFVTPAYTEWVASRLGELREKYTDQRGAGCNRVPSGVQPGTERGATQDEAGCNEVPSGVQRVAYKTSTNHLSKTINDPNSETSPAPADAGDGHAVDNDHEAAFDEDQSAALDERSTNPDLLRFEQLARKDPEMRRLSDAMLLSQRSQDRDNGTPSQWTQRFTG